MSTADSPSARRKMSGQSTTTQAPKDTALPRVLLGKLATPASHPFITVAETLLLPLIAIALGVAWAAQDPLQIQAPFPWPWLAPVVLALRYGPMAGLGGACVLLAGWLLLNLGHWDEFPQIYFLGGLILVMLVGEFSSLWRTRARRAETLQQYLEQRMEHLVRQHYLLRLSHDRLEQELIGRPMSMRDALLSLRAGSDDDTPAAQALLRLLAQYCQLENAALYPMQDGQVMPQPDAMLGNCDALQADDPLLLQAVQTQQTCHISQMAAAEQQSRYLVAAPLLDLAGEPYALLLVQDMPFFALQQENLQTLQLLLNYYTDGQVAQALAQPLVQQFPDCPQPFAFELQRLAHIRATAQVSSIIVALEFHARALEQHLPTQILRLKRELDETWLIEGETRQALAVLMPLGDAATAEGYIRRIEDWVQHKSGTSLAQAGIFAHVVALDTQDPVRTVARLHGMAHA